MANLKSIKKRISSVQSTQKITRAMQMVATAKVTKAENAVKMSRPFTRELYQMFNLVYQKIADKKIKGGAPKGAIDNYIELLQTREVKNTAFLVISSNKGLAGAYNSNIVRYTLNKIKQTKDKYEKIKLYVVGQKALAQFKSAQKTNNFEIANYYTNVLDDLNSTTVKVLSEDLASAYINKEIDEIVIITTRYQNMVSYKITEWTLLPAMSDEKLNEFHPQEEEKQREMTPDTLFEPSCETILEKLVPMYITNVIYQALLEAQASEFASRMTAMSTATKNADEIIKSLTIDYNKARQEKITQELTEIVSGANAIK